uniref:Uncharacterized protein n=1 Tax=Eutreptiella gymnastica TaxID=73025 RepID=A0A7S4LIB2_9EUGL|mmetsp:Transcript_88076/g.146493  ORF Transcript_88076/g.146493 Transcript_88076/m.146493 type:complete len:111 (-) Transcript_88076:65-397(-)
MHKCTPEPTAVLSRSGIHFKTELLGFVQNTEVSGDWKQTSGNNICGQLRWGKSSLLQLGMSTTGFCLLQRNSSSRTNAREHQNDSKRTHHGMLLLKHIHFTPEHNKIEFI